MRRETKFNRATRESIETVIHVSSRALPDPRMCYIFFDQLDKSMSSDERGRVNFKLYKRYWRRWCVMKSFNGKNQQEIADSLKIPLKTVENDIAWYYDNQKKPAYLRVKFPAVEIAA